jgi:methionyl-tRNA formyltransferase
MDEGLDTGPVALRSSTPIGPYEDSGALFERLADLGADILLDGLNLLDRKALVFEPQPEIGASYAKKIEPSEAFVDWRLPAEKLSRIGRALSPHMAMRAYLGADPFSLWRAEACDASIAGAQPGQILRVGRDAMDIACGHGALRVYEIQKPGGKRLAPWAVKQGYPLAEGRVFSSAAS